MSGQEVSPVVRPNAPIPGGPSEPAGNKSTLSSPHTPAGEGQAVMVLVGRGRHLAAEESLGLVVKPASCETGLRHRVSRYEKVLSLELVFPSLWSEAGQSFPLPPPCRGHDL